MKSNWLKLVVITAAITVTSNLLSPIVYAEEITESQTIITEEKNNESNIKEEVKVQEKEAENQVKEEVKEEDNEEVNNDENEVKEDDKEEVNNTTVEETFKDEGEINVKEEKEEVITDGKKDEKVKEENKEENAKLEKIPIEAWEGNETVINTVCEELGIADISEVTYEDIKNIKYLNLIDMEENYIPEIVGKFENLEGLNLRMSNVRVLPNFIGNLKNLKELLIGDLELDSLPNFIGNLTELEILEVCRNNFTEIPDIIFHMKNLKYLDIRQCNISDIPANITNLKNLEYLDLNYNEIINIPQEIIDMAEDNKNLIINLNHNQISNFSGNNERIWISGNFLSYRVYNVELGNELKLVEKSLKIDKGEIIDGNLLKSLVKGVKMAESGWIIDFQVDKRHEIEMIMNGKIITPEEISKLEEGVYKINLKLKSATLDNKCAITKDVLNLVIGNAEENPDEDKPAKDPVIPENATGIIPIEYWQECNPLMFFVSRYLDKNIDDVTFEDIKEISYLDLECTRINDLPKIVEKFENLEEIDLGGNKFKEIPEELYKLEKLVYIDISGSKITSISKEIGKLKNLEYLDLSFNDFTNGNFKELNQLKQLKYLNLEGCNISDINQIANMNSLKVLNMFFNQLINIPNMPNTEIYYEANLIPCEGTVGSGQIYIGEGMELEFRNGDYFDTSIFNSLLFVKYYDPGNNEEIIKEINPNHKIEFIVNGEIVSSDELTNMPVGEYEVKLKLVGADIENTAAITENTIKVTILEKEITKEDEKNDPIDNNKDDNKKDDNKNPVVKEPVNKLVEDKKSKLPYTGGISSMATILIGGTLIGIGLKLRRKLGT